MTDQLTYDAVVIGAGHNGLVAATVLAKQGQSVCVIEKAAQIGGMAANAEIAPGVHLPRIAHLLYNLNPTVARELGIAPATTALPTVSLSPDGRHVLIDGDAVSFTDGAAHPDAAAHAAIVTRLRKFAGLLGQLSTRTPPAIAAGLVDIGTLAKLGLNLKRLGRAEMREFLRVLLTNAYDLILDDMHDGPLAGALAADAVRGAFAGPRSPGTVFALMYRLGNGGAVHLPTGGMGAVMAGFETAARRAGCEVRTGVGVAKILTDGDRATGVELTDGTVIASRTVLSSIAALTTMHLAGPAHFDTEAVRRLRNIRARGTTGKVNLVLRDMPVFTGLTPAHTAARLLIATSAAYVETAFNPVKYGEMSRAPVIEAVIPTLTDRTIAPDGTHILSAIVSYIPQDADRDAVMKLTLDTLDTYAPGLSALVTEIETLTPADIATQTAAPGGHWHHGEMSLDQILTLRPANGMARYRFGPAGLYLCGAAAHPGGDLTGAPGRNAALQAIRDGVFK